MTDSQSIPKQHLRYLQIMNLMKSSTKFEPLDKREFELTEMRRVDSCLLANCHS